MIYVYLTSILPSVLQRVIHADETEAMDAEDPEHPVILLTDTDADDMHLIEKMFSSGRLRLSTPRFTFLQSSGPLEKAGSSVAAVGQEGMARMMDLMSMCPNSIMRADFVDAILNRQMSILSPILNLLGAYSELVLKRQGQSHAG